MFRRQHAVIRAAAQGKSRLRAPPGMETDESPMKKTQAHKPQPQQQQQPKNQQQQQQQPASGFAARVQQMLRDQQKLAAQSAEQAREQQQRLHTLKEKEETLRQAFMNKKMGRVAGGSNRNQQGKQGGNTAAANEDLLPEEIEAKLKALRDERSIVKQRRDLLWFHDVADGLDLFDWRRDTLGYVGGMFNPLEYMVNYYLKWELRFMTHDANKELVNCIRSSSSTSGSSSNHENETPAMSADALRGVGSSLASFTTAGKLFDAPAYLHPIGVPFPVIPQMWWMGDKHKDMPAAQQDGDQVDGGSKKKQGDAVGRVFYTSAKEFRRPTLVLMSPIGFDGSICTDDEWISLVESHPAKTGGSWTCPKPTRKQQSVLRNLGLEIAPRNNSINGNTSSSSSKSSSQKSSAANQLPHKHLSVMRLRTWAIRGTEQLGAWASQRVAAYYPYEVCESAYVGVHLERSFIHSDLPIRNWQATYAMLVDHRGCIRWVATGSPSGREAQALHGLIAQLEKEYVAATSNNNDALRKKLAARLPVASAPDGGRSLCEIEREQQIHRKGYFRQAADDDEMPVKGSVFRRAFPGAFKKIDEYMSSKKTQS